MTSYKKIVIFSMLELVILDLLSKYLAFVHLESGSVKVIDGFFSLSLAYNTGVSFSMFNNLAYGQIILSAVALLAGFVLIFLALKAKNKLDCYGYTLVAAGAFANGIDRAYNGHVIDFLDFYYKNWHYPTFNFADCFIFIGVVILLLEGVVNKIKS